MVKKIIILVFCVLFFLCSVFFCIYLNNSNLFVEEVHSVDLIAGGDIMLSRGIGWWAKKNGYGWVFSGNNYNPLSQYSCYALGDCLLVFNLESLFSKIDNDIAYGGFLFRSNTGNIQYLLDLKNNNNLVVSLANNHTSNVGGDGVELTREILSGENIGFFGAGKTPDEAKEIYFVLKNGISFCFQAFSYDGVAGTVENSAFSWNPLKMDLVKESLDIMVKKGCDVRIIVPHWGSEYRFHPAQWQRDFAYEMIDNGADIIIGNHSHVPGSYEKYKGKPIFYSFGNFIFDQDRGKNEMDIKYDYIYDFKLNRKTVPTYIVMLAALKINKYGTGIDIGDPEFRMARINRGLYSKIDSGTFAEVMDKIIFK